MKTNNQKPQKHNTMKTTIKTSQALLYAAGMSNAPTPPPPPPKMWASVPPAHHLTTAPY
ncbi:MAG: hypothetical protein KatS3mg028_0024 [Bacteroidia bacterium]|nr:MAG: hypothetical protein KatS3mg028_0024 [Bacteroidia bacterium]